LVVLGTCSAEPLDCSRRRSRERFLQGTVLRAMVAGRRLCGERLDLPHRLDCGDPVHPVVFGPAI